MEPSKVVETTAHKPPNAGKGRAKGTPNKTTALLKDAILKAADQAGGGGKKGLVAYLKSQAVLNPGPFMALLGKVLPMQVNFDGKTTHEIGASVTELMKAIDGRTRSK